MSDASDAVVMQAWGLGPKAAPLSPALIADALAAPECAWVHLDGRSPGTGEWIDRHLDYLPQSVRGALVDPETRPRFAAVGPGALLILRGINLNPGAEPEDMVSIRVYADPSRVVSFTMRTLRSVDDMADECRAGNGPRTAGEFLARLCELLEEKIEAAVLSFDGSGDRIEDELFEGRDAVLRSEISAIRQSVAQFRRFLAPQLDAVSRLLSNAPEGLLTETDRQRLGEVEVDLRRDTELVVALAERMLALKDEMQHLSDERLNRNLYILSVVSAVFLPLGFLTGLMGINLAGMPGANWSGAFWAFTGSLALLTAGLLLLLWRFRFVRTPARGQRRGPAGSPQKKGGPAEPP